jgi:mono/diheme cytochrome c family protein
MRMLSIMLGAPATAALMAASPAVDADAAAGRSTFKVECAQCHAVADFQGEDPRELATTLTQIASGQKKHKKPLQLTNQQISDLASYMAAGYK